VHQSILQEDDGLTFAAQGGARYRTAFTLLRAGGELTLKAEVSGDGFPEFARERFVLVLHGATPEVASLDDTMIIGTGGRFELPNEGVDFSFRCSVTD
jgi:alpha-glucosidase